MGDFDDFGELYADLEDQVIAGVEAAELEKGEKCEPGETGAGCEDGVLLSWSSSDSEDDLHIVLNEVDYPNKLPPQLIAEGRDCEEDEWDDDLVIVAGPDRSGKEPLRAEQGPLVDGSPLGSGDRGITTKGAHWNLSRQNSTGSTVRAQNLALGRGHWDHLTVPDSLSNASYSFGYPMTFSNACDFYLRRNRSIFDIDMESFECKPWRFIGVDITDYFNFGLDEEGWKIYCKQLVHLQQNKLTTHETSSLNQPGQVAAEACDDGLPTILDYLDKERKVIQMPKGRAIQVESGNRERIPSVDVRRMRNWNYEVVIQITTGLVVEDALDPIIGRANQVDESGTEGDMLSSSKTEPCKSSFSVDTFAQKCEKSLDLSDCQQPDSMKCGKSSPSRDASSINPDAVFSDHHSNSKKTCDHNCFEASIDGVFVEKIFSPDCKHLDLDSRLQESVFSDCHPSSETGSDMSKTDRTTYGDDSSNSQGQNLRRRTVSPIVGRLDAGSDDDGIAAVHCSRRKDGEHKTSEIGTIVRNFETELDERDHSTEDDKILLKSSINNYNGKEANISFVEYSKNVRDEDGSPIHHKKKGSTATDVKTRQNDGYIIRMAQHNRRTRNIVNMEYIQASSENISLNDKRNMHFWRRNKRIHEYDLRMVANRHSGAAKYRQRERSFEEYRDRSFDEYFGRCVPYLYEKNNRFLDENERVPCSVGKATSQELDNYNSILLLGLERSGRYVDECEDSKIHEGGLHPRIFRDEYDVDERGWHDDGSHRNQVPRVFNKRHMRHRGYSDAGDTLYNLCSNHHTLSSKECHHFSSKNGFKFDNDHFSSEPRGICPNNCAYSERRKNNLAFPRLITREEVTRHQDSINLCSRKRNTIYGTLQHENDQVNKKSFISQKISNHNIYANHLQDSSQRKLNGRGCKDSDSGFPLGSPSDKSVKDKHELAYRGCVEAVSKHLDGWKGKSKRRQTKSGGLVRTDSAAYKESRESMDDEQFSQCCMTLMDNHFCTSYKEGLRQCKSGYSNNIMNKSSNTYAISQEEIEELEEGQLVEESDDHRTALIECTSDGRIPALTASAVIPSNQLSKHKKDLVDSVQRKLIGAYDRNHLLETLAKMEKRRERFRNPIPLKKEPEDCGSMQYHTPNQDEVKQHRPTRKRRWGSS